MDLLFYFKSSCWQPSPESACSPRDSVLLKQEGRGQGAAFESLRTQLKLTRTK